MVWRVRTGKLSALAIGYVCIFVFFSLISYMVYVYYSTIAPSVFKRKKYRKFVFDIIYGYQRLV
jgi:hypothetical protein